MAIKRRNKVSAEFSMSSLTDIIFLLLIFFMLTSSLVNINPLNLDLPQAGIQTISPTDLSISIKKNGQYYIGSTKIRSSQLLRAIKRAKVGDQGGKPTVTIVPEVGTPFKYIMEVMTTARSLGMSAIIATQPKE